VIVDNKTKLEWQNEAVNKTETKSWEDAIAYCENLNLDGKTDWRLPNINELKSLVDYSKSIPTIVLNLEATTESDRYWTSTINPKDTETVYLVDFSAGNSLSRVTTDSYYTRCVRDYQQEF